MENTSVEINMSMLYLEMATISAALQTSLEIQIKDLPKPDRVYWRQQARVKELSVLLGFLKADPNQKGATEFLAALQKEQDELLEKIEKYNSEHTMPE